MFPRKKQPEVAGAYAGNFGVFVPTDRIPVHLSDNFRGSKTVINRRSENGILVDYILQKDFEFYLFQAKEEKSSEFDENDIFNRFIKAMNTLVEYNKSELPKEKF